MIKKIVLVIVLIFSFNIANAIDDQDISATDGGLGSTDFSVVGATEGGGNPQGDINNQIRDQGCEVSGNCLDKTSFMIDTTDISPGADKYKGSGITGTANNILGTIIQNLMVAIGVIALLVMSIGAGYMIFYHGQDEYLSKGKTMFTTGITALVIALTSYYLVSLLKYILYTGN